MKEFIKTNRIFLAAVAVLLVLILIMAIRNKPAFTYKVETGSVAALLKDTTALVSPQKLYANLASGNKSIVVIDVRNSDDFGKGHIDNAINIPVRDLLGKRQVKLFNELKATSAEAILYGESQLQANGPWMLLKQIGYDNLKVMTGSYEDYKALSVPDSMRKTQPVFAPETRLLDTSAFIKTVVSPSPDPSKKESKKVVVPVKKERSSGGGC